MHDLAFMMWDGLGFFGFEDRKVGRLEGKPVRYSDKFTNVTGTPIMVIGHIIGIIIIVNEAGNWLNKT